MRRGRPGKGEFHMVNSRSVPNYAVKTIILSSKLNPDASMSLFVIETHYIVPPCVCMCVKELYISLI